MDDYDPYRVAYRRAVYTCTDPSNRTYKREHALSPDDTNARSRKRRKSVIDELKSNPCQDCGLMFPPECMDFDHRPGEVKVTNVARLRSSSIDKIMTEIAKCDLVCSNCHRTRTVSRL